MGLHTLKIVMLLFVAAMLSAGKKQLSPLRHPIFNKEWYAVKQLCYEHNGSSLFSLEKGQPFLFKWKIGENGKLTPSSRWDGNFPVRVDVEGDTLYLRYGVVQGSSSEALEILGSNDHFLLLKKKNGDQYLFVSDYKLVDY